MSQLEINRTPTEIDLDAYNKILELSTYSMEVCKPKTKKNKDGTTRSSNHHIQARFRKVGEDIEQNIFSIGAMTLEANELYIGKNLNKADRLENYNERIRLQTKAIAKTYYIEHCIRVLHKHRPFADSTLNWWTHLLVETRRSLIAWKNSDVRGRKGCEL